MSNAIIDPHLHLFNLEQGDYHWLRDPGAPDWPNLDRIRQSHTEAVLLSASPYPLAGLVHIEAGFDNDQPVRELDWLQQAITRTLYRAIAYSRIDQPVADFVAAVHNLQRPALAGIRDITEGEDGVRLLTPTVTENLAHLAEQGLIFEAQFNWEDLSVAQAVADYAKAIPSLKLVLNHAGLPLQIEAWQRGLELLRECQNIRVKFSGLELIRATASPQWLLRTLLESFGDARVMLASNFPVCHITQDYASLWQGYRQLVSDIADARPLNDDEQAALWQALSHTNAHQCYGFT
ncbi:amidohydrolase family protein [Nitrincola sp. MINF-07-Sa-05]|uniref:amidohydrolase family protein n=1 Tax=Nitrincola salilacus TaxID=3400273 RepID=UPI0039183CF0